MLRASLLSLVMIVSAGCATNTTPLAEQRGSRWSAYPTVRTGVPLAQDSSVKNGDKYICDMETLVGTHIPERICRPVNAETERAAQVKRDETQARMFEIERTPKIDKM